VLNATNINEENITNRISLVKSFFVNVSDIKSAEAPKMNSELNTLLPTTLPTLISALPSRALKKLTTNSGILVPKATTVRPITISLTFQRRAMEEAPSVNLSAPHNTIAIPNKRRHTSITIDNIN
jgi:hypothetical protein